MGRIKTTLIKRITFELISKNPGVFKEDFQSNKELVDQFAEIPSKKTRNIIAGYVTRLVQSKKDLSANS